MNCPICGNGLTEGMEYCSVCGASVESFANVDPEKVINYQSSMEHERLGDDSRTILLPENYETATGDDSKTILIPENYETAIGDDSKTVFLPENCMGSMGQQPLEFTMREPSPQMNFSQPAMSQPQMNYGQPAMSQPQMNYGQPAMAQPQMNYGQPAMAQPQMGFGGMRAPIAVNNTMLKIFSILTGTFALLTIIFAAVFNSDPVYHIYMNYWGDVGTKNIWKDAAEEAYEASPEISGVLGTFAILIIVAFVIALILAVVGFVTSVNKTKRPNVVCPVFAMLASLGGTIVMAFLKLVFDISVKEVYDESDLTVDEINIAEASGTFGVYDCILLFAVIAFVVSIINLVAAAKTSGEWKKSNIPF